VAAGAVQLVGTDGARLVREVSLLLTDARAYAARQIDQNPYGDGRAAQRIVGLLAERAWESASPLRAVA
jgi:UDP-N-acetylglucosamine 2-epimerase (non-hydrolysing)